MDKFYTASKSRSQGRESWSVIFRHPQRLDADGRPGKRVRRGLGTAVEADANQLIEQINEILKTPTLWEPSAREAASARFDERVVEIFYDGLESSKYNFALIRDELLPMPSKEQGYRRVLLLGTTGAGKTTVVRQLLGTDPQTERFPSTSTAKTTVADTELVMAEEGPFRAAITFVSRDEVVDYLTENASQAAMAVFEEKGDTEVTRRLLDHVNQRFRFSYVLGKGSVSTLDDDDDVDDEETEMLPGVNPEEYGHVDLVTTNRIVSEAVGSLRELVAIHIDRAREELGASDDDERVLAELIEENLDGELRKDEAFHRVVDELTDEIEKRFVSLELGTLRRSKQGWPLSWEFETEDRELFVKTVSRFSSNYAPLFGRLLTPLVNGVRVSGPFKPAWSTAAPRLVLIDGEGLGHTPNSAATLSTNVARKLDDVDAIVLVDSAAQPMQAAPVAAMKAVTVSGNGSKLSFLFTHFDQVVGDNLRSFDDRVQHVLASVQNVLQAIGDELGPAAERLLRQRLDADKYFVGGINSHLDSSKKSGRRAIAQLEDLVRGLESGEEGRYSGPSRPVFDRMNLSLAVTEAAKSFHSKWRGVLGLESNPAYAKEHWTRVKALTRRFAEQWSDEYDTLKPVADLRNELQTQVYLTLQRPLRWEGGSEPTDDEKQIILDEVANAVAGRLIDLAHDRIADESLRSWQEAYALKGTGSTFVRARIIASDVYEKGAPIPTVVATMDQNRFLRSVVEVVSTAAEEYGLVLE